MGEEFDPYLHWLGIRDPQRPPNYYRLLGIELFESDPEVISNAADRQMAHVRTFQTGKHSALSQKLLNELAAAKICLLNPDRKAQYDAQLLAQQAAQQYMPPLTTATPPGVPPPGGLWPLNFPSVPTAAPEFAPPESETAPSASARPWFSVIATVLVAVILVLVGLIVAVTVQKQRKQAGSSPESAQTTPEEVSPPPTPPIPPEKPLVPGKPSPPGQEKPKRTPPEKPKPPEGLPPARDSLQAARQALAQRDIPLARKHLDLAQRAAPLGSPEADETARLHIICTTLEEFWKAVADALPELRPAEKLLLGPSKQEVLIKGFSGGTLEVEINGQQQSFTLKNMPLPLALALSQRKLPENPTSLLKQAAAFLFDPEADLTQAELLIQQAIEKHAFQAEEFAEELKLAQATRPTPPPQPPVSPPEKPQPEPTPKLEPKPEEKPPAKPTPPRHPVPDSETQQKMLAEIREIFDRDYKAAKKPEEKAKLAETLYRQGVETRDNPAAQYMLFLEARNLALEVGAGDLLDRSLRRIAQNFDVDLIDLADEFFEKAAKQSRTTTANKTAAQTALDFAREAFAQDKLDQAMRLAQSALEMARKATDPVIAKKAMAARRQYEDFKPRYEAFREADKQLQSNPDDPEANLIFGSYLCFAKQEWQAGLRHLAKGKDPVLKKLAEKELASPHERQQMLELGDEWWQASESAGPETIKDAYRNRAAYWYRRIQPHVSGLTKTRVDRRLQEVSQ